MFCSHNVSNNLVGSILTFYRFFGGGLFFWWFMDSFVLMFMLEGVSGVVLWLMFGGVWVVFSEFGFSREILLFYLCLV